MELIAWAAKHWRAIVLGVLLLGLSGWHFQDKISDMWDQWTIDKQAAQIETLTGRIEALETAKRLQDAANEAAQAARNRNDEVIPAVRRDTQARVDRAGDADAAQRVRDVAETTRGYQAAADSLRGKSAR